MPTRKRAYQARMGSDLTAKGKNYKSQYKFNKKMYKLLKSSGVPTVKSLPIGFPEEMRVKLVYSDINDTVVLAAPGYNQTARFAMTNLVDPDITGTGAQPPLFDNLKALYTRWRVNSAKLTVDVENYTNSPCMVTLVGLFEAGNNNPTSPSNQNNYDLMALPSKERSARKRLGTINAQPANRTRITKTFKPDDFIGQDYFTSVNYAGNQNSAPSNYAVIDLIAQSCRPDVTSEIGLWLSWRIEYDVTFFEQIATEIAAYD